MRREGQLSEMIKENTVLHNAYKVYKDFQINSKDHFQPQQVAIIKSNTYKESDLWENPDLFTKRGRREYFYDMKSRIGRSQIHQMLVKPS